MNKIKLYRKILLIELSIIATLVLHHFVSTIRGYKAIGGELLVIPLLIVVHTLGQALKLSWEEIEKHFKEEV